MDQARQNLTLPSGDEASEGQFRLRRFCREHWPACVVAAGFLLTLIWSAGLIWAVLLVLSELVT